MDRVAEESAKSGIQNHSEFLSIFAIICCVLAFYFYLQRLELPHVADSMWQDPEPVRETKVIATTLPFRVTPLDNPPVHASMKDGLLITVETSVPCFLQSFWKVECRGLTETLRSCDMAQRSGDHIVLEDRLQEISHSSSDKYFFDADISREIQLKMKADDGSRESDDDLGPSPRSRYPLGILVTCGQGESMPESPPLHTIESVLWIFHLPDETVTRPCHVISQLIITTQGQVCNLQKMYMASEGEGHDVDTETNAEAEENHISEQDSVSNTTHHGSHPSLEPSPNTHQGADSNDTFLRNASRSCTVCQNAPISRAIIPCRHACVCEHCLGLLFACPMCRGPITSHFQIIDRGGSSARDGLGAQPGDGPGGVQEVDWVMRIQHGMERLNEWLGFV